MKQDTFNASERKGLAVIATAFFIFTILCVFMAGYGRGKRAGFRQGYDKGRDNAYSDVTGETFEGDVTGETFEGDVKAETFQFMRYADPR